MAAKKAAGPDPAAIAKQASADIKAAKSLEELEAVRVRYLGRKGEVTAVLRTLGGLSAAERPKVGAAANRARVSIEEALEAREAELTRGVLEEQVLAEAVDVSLPGRRPAIGREHLVNKVMNDIIDIFLGLGYQVAEGPEVELDYYNFEALNMPPDHPARTLWDTLYVTDAVLLRTHTSPVQIRVMEAQSPPLYILSPGKTYRRDTADATHLPMFQQVEGFVVDEGITMGDLKGTLEVFAQEMFGEDRRVRLRPSFFPFTEPSAEVDVSCGICGGKGCRSCGDNGWLEILGCGMIDPNVLECVGIDSERYTGFAFGMGVERIAMLKYGIPDLRLFHQNDLRFLRQF